MERYLSFELSDDDAKQSDFTAYTLGTGDLLPHYFGDVAPINIFLGENNSGKSRFMRAIMKCDPTNLLVDFDTNQLFKYIESASESTKNALEQDLPIIDVVYFPHNAASFHGREFLSISEEEARRNSQMNLKIDPTTKLNKYTTILNTILDNITTVRNRLNFVSLKHIDEIIGELTEVHSSLERARKIYLNLWDKNKHGYSPHLIEGKKLHYNSAYGTLALHTSLPNEFAKAGIYTKVFGKTTSDALSTIIESVKYISNQLEILIRSESKTHARTYIPTLRTARTLITNTGGSGGADTFHMTTAKDYELTNSPIVISTGLSMFNDIHIKRNSDLEDREEFDAFEIFLSVTFFNAKRVQVVPNTTRGSITVTVAREERSLPHLGDGIQAVIMLLYPLFTAVQDSWFFIEEPETHMHPGFQRIFIDTIATNKIIKQKNLTIFLTTHSNHFLDFAFSGVNNINIFSFRKIIGKAETPHYQIQSTLPHDLECLTALGVQNSSVFLSNCTIWVEGITDRIYIKAYLAAYLKHRSQTFSLLEGLHYSFLEYAGANVSHYTFGAKAQQITVTNEALREIRALSISNRIMLIADQDSGKETRHEQRSAQQHAGFEYVVLPTREIENLLSPEIIVGALKKLYPKQAEYFDADQLKQGQYKTIYLAKHLQGKFSQLPASFGGASGSGTVSSNKKRQFAEAAAELITSWEMLSLEAQELTKQIFQFIMGHNPRLGSN